MIKSRVVYRDKTPRLVQVNSIYKGNMLARADFSRFLVLWGLGEAFLGFWFCVITDYQCPVVTNL